MPTLTGMSDAKAARRPITAEIEALWAEHHQLVSAHQSLLDRIRSLESDVRGHTQEDAPSKAPARLHGVE